LRLGNAQLRVWQVTVYARLRAFKRARALRRRIAAIRTATAVLLPLLDDACASLSVTIDQHI
jgi:hypothetical protein